MCAWIFSSLYTRKNSPLAIQPRPTDDDAEAFTTKLALVPNATGPQEQGAGGDPPKKNIGGQIMYAHHIITCPTPLDFQYFLRPCATAADST